MSYIVQIATFVLLICLPAVAQEERSAPFGLIWGMSLENVKAISGVTLSELKAKDGSTTFVATALPKVLEDTESVRLNFGFNNQLWQIVAASKSFTNDPYGNVVRHRYDELIDVLTQKYGNGKQHRDSEPGFYSEPNNFVYSIYKGERSYYTDFTTKELAVQLAIRSTEMDSAFYVLFYEYLPLKEEFERGAKAKQKDAL